MDPELGLINMRGRIYDPHLGQFLTADPLMTEPEGAGLNRFAYVKNGPLDATDPTGLFQKPICFNCPDYTAFPGNVNQPGPSTGSTGIGPSAANPVSPASSGAAPASAGVSGGESADLAPGDAASGWDILGYGIANGPAIADSAIRWAKTAEHQEHTWKPVAMTRTEPGSDAAVRPYGNSPNGLATGGGLDMRNARNQRMGGSGIASDPDASFNLMLCGTGMFECDEDLQPHLKKFFIPEPGVPSPPVPQGASLWQRFRSLLGLGDAAAKGAGNFTRALQASDFGAKTLRVLDGSLSVEGKVATVTIRNIQGNLGNPVAALNALKDTARQAGATTLRIQGTVANPRLAPALERLLGLPTRGAPGGPQDIWVLGL